MRRLAYTVAGIVLSNEKLSVHTDCISYAMTFTRLIDNSIFTHMPFYFPACAEIGFHEAVYIMLFCAIENVPDPDIDKRK